MTRRRYGDWLTVTQAAQLLGVSRQTLYNWVELQLLAAPERRPEYRHPRFAKANLEKLKKTAAATGRPLTYYLAAQRKRDLGIPDGRALRYAGTNS